MNLSGCSSDKLTESKIALDNFLGEKDTLVRVRQELSSSTITEEQRKILQVFERTLLCNIIEDPAAKELKDKIIRLENELAAARNKMPLGYTNPTDGLFVKASSVQLRNLMRSSPDEAVRLPRGTAQHWTFRGGQLLRDRKAAQPFRAAAGLQLLLRHEGRTGTISLLCVWI